MAHWDRRELNKLVAESPEEYKKRFPEPFSAMIPEDASSENKLATEAYVNEHGGGGSGSDPEAVKYTEQTLTEEQKAQARTNIGAASEAAFVNALGGKKIWTGTAAEYALLTPANDTIYFITP